MTQNIIPLRFNVEQVGKHVKASKKRFTWEISINNKSHTIGLDFSFISGKVKVTVDRKILLENQLPANTSFQYPFTLDGNSLNVIQQGENFELRINNKVFSHLYNQMKTNKQFKKYEDQIKDFKVSQNQFQAKKLTLNIGGVGGMVKKKSKIQSSQGHNWNAFGQEQMGGFPSYFQGQSVSTTGSTQKTQQPVPKNISPNLLDDSILNSSKGQQKTQNILDFQAQIQKPTVAYSTKTNQGEKQFSTMQMMFNTMKLGNTPQYKQQVVISSNQVDFFNSGQDQSINNQSVVEKQKIDFLSGMNVPQQINPPLVNNVTKNNEFSTMQFMFATNNNEGSSMNQGISFNTSNSVKPQSQSHLAQNLSFNLHSSVQQPLEATNFSTMQHLFSTNSMTTTPNIQGVQNFSPNTGVPAQVNQQQFFAQNNLQTRNFSTQSNGAQNFGSSFNINAQSFGTQKMMGNNMSIQNTDFLSQKNLSQQVKQMPSQQVSLNQQSPGLQQSMGSQNIGDINNINLTDFNSMQMLFKSNSFSTPTQSQQMSQAQPSMKKQTSNSVITQLNMSCNPVNPQMFSTGTGISSTSSPNTMFMNTYSGNPQGSSNSFGFDLGTNNQPQFGTSANLNMMKKPSVSTVSPVVQTTNTSGDLI